MTESTDDSVRQRQETQPEGGTAFGCVIDRGRLLEFLQTIQAVTDEQLITIGDEGWEVYSIDPANVAMVKARLTPDAFDVYGQGELEVGINAPRLRRRVEHFPENCGVQLQFHENENKVSLQSGAYTSTYAHIDSKHVRQPGDGSWTDSADLVLRSGQFRDVVAFMDEFTDGIWIGYDPTGDEFTIEGEGDTDEGRFSVPGDELPEVSEAGPARSYYSLDYLTDFTEVFPEGRELSVRFGEDTPITFEFGIIEADGVYHGEVRFSQAPRVTAP